MKKILLLSILLINSYSSLKRNCLYAAENSLNTTFKKYGDFTALCQDEGTLRNSVSFCSTNPNFLIKELWFGIRKNGNMECFCYTRKEFPFKYAKKIGSSYDTDGQKNIFNFLEELKMLKLIREEEYSNIIKEIKKPIDEEKLKGYEENNKKKEQKAIEKEKIMDKIILEMNKKGQKEKTFPEKSSFSVALGEYGVTDLEHRYIGTFGAGPCVIVAAYSAIS